MIPHTGLFKNISLIIFFNQKDVDPSASSIEDMEVTNVKSAQVGSCVVFQNEH